MLCKNTDTRRRLMRCCVSSPPRPETDHAGSRKLPFSCPYFYIAKALSTLACIDWFSAMPQSNSRPAATICRFCDTVPKPMSFSIMYLADGTSGVERAFLSIRVHFPHPDAFGSNGPFSSASAHCPFFSNSIPGMARSFHKYERIAMRIILPLIANGIYVI